MRFLVDRCAGHRLAEWLRTEGHDVLEAASLGPDPGDDVLLALAHRERRITVTLDMDFGKLTYGGAAPHAGLVRLPDVRVAERIRLMNQVLDRYATDLNAAAVVTVRGNRVRIRRQ